MRVFLFRILAAAVVLALPVVVRDGSMARAAVEFTVNSTADTVDANGCDAANCTLREAIAAAQANGNGQDTINFAISGDGVKTITLLTPLSIFSPVVLDGTTQGGRDSACPSVRDIRIEIRGSENAQGLWVETPTNADPVVIRGVAIGDFPQQGIAFRAGSGHILECSNIGTDASGMIPAPNGTGPAPIDPGIVIYPEAEHARLGGDTAAARNLISGNTGSGVLVLGGPGTEIKGNWIGLSAGGEGLGNGFMGVEVNGGTNLSISKNVIAANQSDGIEIRGGNGISVQGNLIGLDDSGAAAIGNGGQGVTVAGPGLPVAVVIGGTTPEERNVISGNAFNGIRIGLGSQAGTPPGGVQVIGNYIGTDASGSASVANGGSGISVGSQGNLIGGVSAGQGNVISGNAQDGIALSRLDAGTNPDGNLIQGNRIGTNANGDAALPNKLNGLNIEDGSNNQVGGSGEGAGNLISGNGGGTGGGIGIQVFAANASAANNRIAGNSIGYSADGAAGVPNVSHGIFLDGISPAVTDGTIIGGTAPGEGNRVFAQRASPAAAVRNGVAMVRSVQRTTIRGNGITSDGLGIDIRTQTGAAFANLVLANDPGDGDDGPNALQNWPVVEVFTPGPAAAVAGSLSAAPTTAYGIDFYASASCVDAGDSATNQRIGSRYLGSTEIVTGAGGAGMFNVVLPNAVELGERLTATATDPEGNTSEFSNCGTAPGPSLLALSPDSRVAGSSAFQLQVMGLAMTPSMTLTFDGVSVPGTVTTASTMTATISASLLGNTRATRTVGFLLDDATNVTRAVTLTFEVLRSSSDTDCDGTVSAVDALRVLQVLAALAADSGPCSANADLTGETGLADAIHVLREVAGMIPGPLPSATQ